MQHMPTLYKYTTAGISAAVHAVKPNSVHVASSRHVSEAIEYKSISAEQTR